MPPSQNMTLTRYQRGDQVEGWNDMPPLMVSSKNTSNTTPRPRRKATRVAHDLNTYTSAPPPRDQRSEVPVSSLPSPAHSTLSGPPRMPVSAPVSHSSSPLDPAPRQTNTPINPAPTEPPEELLVRVRDLLSQLEVSRSSLSPDDFYSCVEKVSGLLAGFTRSHAIFCRDLLEEALTTVGSGSPMLKTRVVEYMMQNGNVSNWCIPLRRLVESIR